MRYLVAVNLLLSFLVSSVSLTGQERLISPDLLPTPEPSYVRDLNALNTTDIDYFKNVLKDKDGRLWFDPGDKFSVYTSLNLVQYDGYSFTPINLGLHTELSTMSTAICGITKEGKFFGYTNSIFKNIVFYIAPQSRQLDFFDLDTLHIPGLQIRNVIQTEDFRLLILASTEQHFYLLNLEKGELGVLKKIESEHPIRLPQSSGIPQLPLVETENGIWFSDHLLSLIHYIPHTDRVVRYEADRFLFSPNDKPDYNNFHSPKLIRRQNQLIVYFPAYSGQAFKLDLQKNIITPFPRFPSGWRLKDVFADESDNILLLFQTTDNKTSALVQDLTGQWYNYARFFENFGNERILQIKADNFFQHLFLLSHNHFMSMGIKEMDGILSYTIPWAKGVAGAFLDNKFLFFDENRNSLLIDPAEGIRPITRDTLSYLSCFPAVNGVSRNLVEGRAGCYWTMEGKKVYEFNTLEGVCREYPTEFAVKRMSKINDSTLALVMVGRRMALFNTNKKEVQWIGDYDKEAPGYYFQLHATPDSVFWIPTSGGLWKIDPRTENSEVIGNESGFDDFRFQTILEDRKGRLWLGSMVGGIHIYDPKSAVVEVINENQGLASNSVRSLIQDQEGIMWAGTSNGLSLINEEGIVLYSLTNEDGLPDSKFVFFGSARSKDGHLLFIQEQGIALIDPVVLKKNLLEGVSPGPVFLTSLSYFDDAQNQEVTQSGGISLTKPIKLPAAKRYLKLKVALPDYYRPEENHFAYKIKGRDKDWTYVGSQNELFLNHLSAGRYQLLIKGANYRNLWSSEPLVLEVQAGEFFYKKPWFYLSIFSAISLLVFLWIRRLRLEKVRLEKEVNRRTQQIRTDKELIAQQAEELRRLDELKSRFFTNISHELRTPITLITAPVDKIVKQKATALGKDVQKSLRMVLQNGRNLLQLVEELLDLSKLEANKLELNEKPTPLIRFSRQLFSAFESRAATQKIRYTFNTEMSEDTQYYVDRKRLEKVINNLLSNALKFTVRSGEVSFEVEKKEGRLLFRVTDTGRGIPPEDLPHIFDRYFQTNRPGLAREGGAGIGLALSRELARLMRGELSVQSQWEKGSTFTLNIPARQAEERTPVLLDAQAPTVKIKDSSVSNISGNGPATASILVVEDNLDMQELILSLLSDTYSCRIANNGAEAWQWIDSGQINPADIDLILSDIMMPEMDGHELLERIKQQPQWQQKPMMMLTALADEEDKLQALRLGVDDYLLKPFSPEELMVRLANLIGNYRQKMTFLQKTSREEVNVNFEDMASADQQWLKQLEESAKVALEKKIEISVSYMADQMALSERQLRRRIKEMTGLSSKQYIQEVKLQKARHLLENKVFHTIAEVAYASGFNTPGYFTQVYEKHFGKRPADYLAETTQ